MKILGLIMAGGKGERLYPLTKERSKPAVPFGGKYRIIDFVLSNFINSGIFSIYVLVQYLSQSLIDYLRGSWTTSGITTDHFITVVPPQMRLGQIWYRGTADAVKQNLNLMNDHSPDLVTVFGADHIYRMDISQMVKFHTSNNADITIAAMSVPLKDASRFGIVTADSKNRLTGFNEKLALPRTAPGRPNRAFASLGNYIFTYDALVKVLHEETTGEQGLDFGENIFPNILKRYKIFVYDFAGQKLPGVRDYEEANYWRDVGTMKSFWRAHMDLLGENPNLDLNNKSWPVHSGKANLPPSKIIRSSVQDCMLGDGCRIVNSSLKKCVISNDVTIHDNCHLENCVIMDSCEIKEGSKLRKVIIDRFNVVSPKSVVGYDPEKDMQMHYLDPDGIVVIPRGISKWI